MIPENENTDGTIDPDYRDTDLGNTGEDTETNDLNYNAEEDSFELDAKGDDPDYDHPDPYDTSAKNGEDFNSTYDEANPFDVKGEYDADRSLVTDADSLGMHIDSGKILEIDPLDEQLAHTPEDDRDDLDEEGYPINDTPNDIR